AVVYRGSGRTDGSHRHCPLLAQPAPLFLRDGRSNDSLLSCRASGHDRLRSLSRLEASCRCSHERPSGETDRGRCVLRFFIDLVLHESSGAAHEQAFMIRVLFVCSILGLFSSTVYLLLALIAARRFRRESGSERQPVTELPFVSVLKPLHGMEPMLEGNLESFFRQDYPKFEIVFGARHK